MIGCRSMITAEIEQVMNKTSRKVRIRIFLLVFLVSTS
ncbi:MAG: hypothetical protein K0Q59_3136 [Paenibacillus sp.]|nr:hypothetical protein [Paenibacillus sp.]